MPERPRQHLARARGWLIPAALLALMPKCLLCVLAYAGLGATIELGGREICGPAAESHTWLYPVLGAAFFVAGWLAWTRSHRAS